MVNVKVFFINIYDLILKKIIYFRKQDKSKVFWTLFNNITLINYNYSFFYGASFTSKKHVKSQYWLSIPFLNI